MRHQSAGGLYKPRHTSTHQALRPRIDDADQQKAYREPRLGVRQVKMAERDDPKLLHNQDAQHADGGLDAKEQEVHRKVASRNHILLSASQHLSNTVAKAWGTHFVDHGHQDRCYAIADDR